MSGYDDGSSMLESIHFERTDLATSEYKSRGEWMLQVIRFMRIRGWLNSKWISLTGHLLEVKVKHMPLPCVDLDPAKDLLLSDSLQDLYHSASECKPTFDRFMHGIMKITKPKSTKEFSSWDEYNRAVAQAIHSKKTSATAEIAALDAVPCAIIYQPLKDKERTEQKAKENYHGHVRDVRDVVRGSIVCESDQDILVILSKIKEITSSYLPVDLEKHRAVLMGVQNKLSLAPPMLGQSGGAAYQPSGSGSLRGQSSVDDSGSLVEGEATVDGSSAAPPSQLDRANSIKSMQSAASVTVSEARSGQYEEAKRLREKEIARGMRIVSVKNRFRSTTAHGYRDILISFAVDYIHQHEENESLPNKEPRLELAQCFCELQIHHAGFLYFSKSLQSHGLYVYFRTFFGKVAYSANNDDKKDKKQENSDEKEASNGVSGSLSLSFQNKLKALKTMDQVGEFVEELEAAMQVYLGGMGRVGRDLARLSAYYQLFVRVGEVRLAEAMQSCLIGQLRDANRTRELYFELSTLSTYFKSLKRYEHAKPLSEEALALCEQLNGPEHLETAEQLTKHANLLHCCDELTEALPIFERALEIKEDRCGRLSPLTYSALDDLACVYFDEGDYKMSMTLYKRLLATHWEIARKSRTGQAGPAVGDTLVNLAAIYEVDKNVQDFDQSYKLLGEALRVYEDCYTEEHESRARVLELMAFLKEQEGLLMDALHLHREAEELRLRLFLAQSDYMGLDVNDSHANPPWACIADSMSHIGELLLDLGDIALATEKLREAYRIRKILAEPHNYPLSKGKENALLALATVQTHLAYAIIQGPKKRNHHLNYYEAQEIIKPAYAARMKYLGIRSMQTLQTINVQGIIDGLILDYNAEKERIKLDRKAKKEKEARLLARKLARQQQLREQGIIGPAIETSRSKTMSPTSSSSNLNETPTGQTIPTSPKSRSQSVSPSRQNSIQNVLSDGKAGGSGVSSTSQAVDAISSTGAQSSTKGSTPIVTTPTPMKIGQKRVVGDAVEEEKVAVEEVVEEVDELAGHVHSKGIYDLDSRQQLDETVAKAQDMLETAERLRDLGEYNSALSVCQDALDTLRPDLAVTDDGSSQTTSLAEGVAAGTAVVPEAPGASSEVQSATSSTRKPDCKLAYAIALSMMGTIYLDRGWYLHAVNTFQKSLDLIILTYGDQYVHRDIAETLFSLGNALHLAGEYEAALEVCRQARTQWVAIIQRETVIARAISEGEAAEDALLHPVTTDGDQDEDGIDVAHEAENEGKIDAVPSHSSIGAFSRQNSLSIAALAEVKESAEEHSNASCSSEKEQQLEADNVSKHTKGDSENNSIGQGSTGFVEEFAFNPEDDPNWYSIEHADALRVVKLDHSIALSLYGIGEFAEAHTYIVRALDAAKEKHASESHPDVVAIMNSRGLIEAGLGEFEDTFTTFNDVLKLRSRVYGTSDPAYALGVNNYGAAMFMVDDLALAGRTWIESIELRERQVAVGSQAVATALFNMNALFVRGEAEETGIAFVKGRETVMKFLDMTNGEPVLPAEQVHVE